MALLQNYRLRPRVDDEHETIQVPSQIPDDGGIAFDSYAMK